MELHKSTDLWVKEVEQPKMYAIKYHAYMFQIESSDAMRKLNDLSYLTIFFRHLTNLISRSFSCIYLCIFYII